MKMNFKTFLIILLLFFKLQVSYSQTVNISFDMLECVHECYNCKKTDKYFFALPSKIDYENQRNQAINDNRYSKEDHELIFPLTVSIADKLTLENDEGVSRLSLPSLMWYTYCPMPPRVEPKKGCIKNYNDEHELLHLSDFNKTCRIYNYNTNVLKKSLDQEIERSKRIQLEIQEKEQEEKIKQNTKLELTSKIEAIFLENIIPSFEKAKNKDTTGVKELEIGIKKLSGLWNHKIDAEQTYVINDSLSFSFRGLFKLYALSYLYAGNYETGISKIKEITNKIPQFNDSEFHAILGVAYLMNCQSIKASETLILWKPANKFSCEQFNSNITELLNEMRSQHPELKCIKLIRTLPILAAISCS